jgi:hypothetical protein
VSDRPATLCLRPAPGEPVETVKYVLREPLTTLAVAARHLIAAIDIDPDDGRTPTVWFDEATHRARPVHVRLELVAHGDRAPVGARQLGTVGDLDVYGTYLGPVSEEN